LKNGNYMLKIIQMPFFLTKHIVNLPTDDVDVYNVISFINLNKDQLLEL